MITLIHKVIRLRIEERPLEASSEYGKKLPRTKSQVVKWQGIVPVSNLSWVRGEDIGMRDVDVIIQCSKLTVWFKSPVAQQAV